MAVKVNNTASLRKAQRWTEKDDAALCLLLKRKIKDVNVALRESESPYERARLKEQKRHYKSMIRKVENGVYNGDVLFSELQAAAALRSEQRVHALAYSTTTGAKRYNSSYSNMDFDYESAFRKKRYYGVALPIILLLLSLIFLAVYVVGAFLPESITSSIDDLDIGLSFDSLFSYKLGPDTIDIEIKNDGVWPKGTFNEDGIVMQEGAKFIDADGNEPLMVKLYADLGMTSVYISPFDLVKAWFKTPMLEKTRLDFLEDNKLFQGTSYYYICFLSGNKTQALVIKKDEDGNFDNSVIFRHIGTYGTIIFFLTTLLFGAISIIINIVRLFTYTSRRIHGFTVVSLLSSLLLMLCPAFASVEGTDIGGAFSSYFAALFDFDAFMGNADATVGISLLALIPVAINVIMLILPFLFRNRLKRRPTQVPAGNRGRLAINDPYYADEETLRRLA